MTAAAISILDLEEAAARGWRAPEEAALGRCLYLQVEDDNPTAHRLYRRIGFADHHAYRYRVARPVRFGPCDECSISGA